ncbi:hypothetical protein [Ferrimonas lipolytica]|uniref:Uncharacterized protein n=1 Tax=Ferrimonas lipolytica TaxID=2724191 RepID=A0A6H1UHF9_9GAMM|nr:hypothetical protein [Ferrimonas lipolytica]QIZ78040.1 hypothetical protein HER31_14725 [Ferrimonas lipolytica]
MKYSPTYIAIAMLPLCVAFNTQAKILNQNTSIGFGGRAHIGNDHVASNKNSFVAIFAKHSLKADWGQLSVKAKYENPFSLKETRYEGKSAITAFKTYADLYYNIGDYGSSLWWEEFSVSTNSMVEVTNMLGGAYAYRFGKLNTRFGFGLGHSMGHTPKDEFDGLAFYGTKVELSYPLNPNISTFVMVESRWDRDQDWQNTYGWDEDHGHHGLIGAAYKVTPNVNVSLAYHKLIEWGGYEEDGDAIDLNISYRF